MVTPHGVTIPHDPQAVMAGLLHRTGAVLDLATKIESRLQREVRLVKAMLRLIKPRLLATNLMILLKKLRKTRSLTLLIVL